MRIFNNLIGLSLLVSIVSTYPVVRLGLADSHQLATESIGTVAAIPDTPGPGQIFDPIGESVPGGVAVIAIEVPEDGRPEARFGNRPLLTVFHLGQWWALVGLASSVLPGNYVVNTDTDKGETGSAEFAVLAQAPRRPQGQKRTASGITPDREAGADSQPLVALLDASEVDINPSIRPLDTRKFTTFSTAPPDLDLSSVTESVGLTAYGAVLDGAAIRRHDYISYQTRSGAQVYAPATGIVRAMTADGRSKKTLYLDHGQGLITILGNVRQPLVALDQVVQRGEQLATAGSGRDTNFGRVDWALQMNGWLVDPAAVTELGLILQSAGTAIRRPSP